MNLLTQLLDLPGFRVDQATIDRDTVTVTAAPSATAAICPTCATPSTRVHSAYTRSLHDLPWGTHVLHLTLALRRFRCCVPACPRQTFVERMPHIAPPYARSTLRVRERRQSVGLALGGEAGARLAARLRIGTSPDTLLRLIRAAPLPSAPPPRIIGIDDWAFRRGQRYGTIVVDLETHRPIELLPDRSATVVAAWLRTQPTIACISRDRGDTYIAGATEGAPTARQVADRWHLIKNVGEALQRLLERHGTALRAAARQTAQDLTPPLPPAPPAVEAIPSMVPPRSAPAHRQQQFAEVKRLHQAGWSIRRIGLELRLNRRTVRKYVHAETVPVRILPQNISHAAAYVPTIATLWQAGCRSYQDLWVELQKAGFRGSYSSVRRLMKQFDPADRRRSAATTATHRTAAAHLLRAASDVAARATERGTGTRGGAVSGSPLRRLSSGGDRP